MWFEEVSMIKASKAGIFDKEWYIYIERERVD